MELVGYQDVLKALAARISIDLNTYALSNFNGQLFCKARLKDVSLFSLKADFSADATWVYFPASEQNRPATNITFRKLENTTRSGDSIVFFALPKGSFNINLGGQSHVLVNYSAANINTIINLWRPSELVIGQDVFCNGSRIIGDNSSTFIGANSLLSDEIVLQSSDQHTLLDATTLRPLHNDRTFLHIGRHCWIGRRAIVTKNVSIGDGSIVGAQAVVTRSCPALCAVAGNPARVVRENVSWSRSTVQPEQRALDLINDIKAKQHQL